MVLDMIDAGQQLSVDTLPVDTVLKDVKEALSRFRGAVIQAPPGSGKTTHVPIALLGEKWLQGKRIVMLEPRRLAARAACHRMAENLGETSGQTVGYRVRMDTRVGPKTRIEVVTEGILTRMIQADPGLSGIGLVIFDEFHERHLQSDLGLALCLDLQGVLNTDLRIVLMSATLETEHASRLLGDAPVITCGGHLFDVETRYVKPDRRPVSETHIADVIRKTATGESGNILVFLPGAAEIRRVLRLLQTSGLGPEWIVAPLFGNMSLDDQALAILPPEHGRRKIVLATNIAETSLTIEGIRVVIDNGLTRVPCFEVQIGMTRLKTLSVSRSSADQRRGRAGRLSPGVCIRLWPEAEHVLLPDHGAPEILQTDLTGLVLELAIWGIDSPARLRWLDLPPMSAFQEAQHLLKLLGALDGLNQVTRHGRLMAGLPLHPRLAHMVIMAKDHQMGNTAYDLAALLSERDVVKFLPGEYDSDLGLRLEILAAIRRRGGSDSRRFSVDRSAVQRCLKASDRLKQVINIDKTETAPADIGQILAWAYPDRIGQRRADGAGRFLLTNGCGAVFSSVEPLSACDYIVAASLDGVRQNARIFLSAGYNLETLLRQYADAIQTRETISWDAREKAVRAVRNKMLGALVLKSEPVKATESDKIRAVLITGIRLEGIQCLPWTEILRSVQQRIQFLRRMFGSESGWPDLSDATLLDSLEDWLAPFLIGMTRISRQKTLNQKQALMTNLSREQIRLLDELAPTHLDVPSGSRIRIDYSGDIPVLAVRVQEMFGCRETPAIASGRQKLLVHLLSPAGRPVQVTQDIAGFWTGSYPDVKKELKGRYPKHDWPDDPIRAVPTNRAKRRGNR